MSTDPLVRAEGMTLTERRLPVWSDLTFTFGPGLAAVCGPTGSGRSSLLLALVGRFAGLSGTLRVAGLDAVGRARRVRAITSVARISTMIDLEPRLTVAESITERSLTDKIDTEAAQQRMGELETRVGHRFVRTELITDLDAYARTLLAACLASLRPARLTVLDDVDSGLSVSEQRRLMSALTRLPEAGSGLVVSTREDAAVPREASLLRLPAHPDRSERTS